MNTCYRWATLCAALAGTSAASAQGPVTTVFFGASSDPAATASVGITAWRPGTSSANEGAPEADPRARVSPSAAPRPASDDRADDRAEVSRGTDAPDEDALRPPCPGAITVVRRMGGRRESVHMAMLDCDGRAREEARRAIAILARPRMLEEPPTEAALAAHRDGDGDLELLAEGVRLPHRGVLERLQRIGEAFEGHPIEILSGYRPQSPPRSRHHDARALDLRVDGVPREALRDFAVGLPETGVGWYPNSVFVHVDVRDEPAYWVDLSGPGEPPRYVRGASPPDPSEDTSASGVEPAEDDVPPPTRDELEALRSETAGWLRQLVVPAP